MYPPARPRPFRVGWLLGPVPGAATCSAAVPSPAKLLTTFSMAPSMPTPEPVLAHLRKNEQAHLAELQDLVRIPSVSADPKNAADVKRAADWIMARLQRAGLENIRLVETSGLPS